MKKILAFFLSMLMLLSLTAFASATSTANEEIWDGSIADAFASGTGTQDDPYIIETAAQLAYLSYSVSEKGIDYSGKFIKLANDICLNDTSDLENWSTTAPANTWTPIGTTQRSFSGNFDGNNKVISGIYVNDVTYAGLFGYCYDVKILNVTIKESYIKASYYSGYAGGLVAYSYKYVAIDNCTNYADVSGKYAGGIVGFYPFGRIYGCANLGTITALGTNAYAGGIVGYRKPIMENETIIRKCYNLGTISGTISGGIVGYIRFPVMSVNTIYLSSTLEINDCYNAGDISSTNFSGGIIGQADYDSSWVGNINLRKTINSSYNIGTLTSNGTCGQFIGRFSPVGSKSVTPVSFLGDNYYCNESNTPKLSIGNIDDSIDSATLLTKEQAQNKDSYLSFDFENVWTMDGDPYYHYPELIDNSHNSNHNHSYSSSITTEPTCTSDGIKTYICECGDSYTEPILHKGHSTNDWTIVNETTCTSDGLKIKYCSSCSQEVEREILPSPGHTSGEWVISNKAACTTDGIKEHFCATCKEVYETETIPSTGHHKEWIVYSEGNCTIATHKVKVCSICEEELESIYIPAPGHNYGVWTTTIVATVDSEGKEARTCANCSSTEERTLPTLEFTISETSLSMIYKDSGKLSTNSSNVTWSTTNSDVATVDSDGNIQAVGDGTATIIATNNATGKTVSCEISVSYTWWQWIIRILLFGFIWY